MMDIKKYLAPKQAGIWCLLIALLCCFFVPISCERKKAAPKNTSGFVGSALQDSSYIALFHKVSILYNAGKFAITIKALQRLSRKLVVTENWQGFILSETKMVLAMLQLKQFTQGEAKLKQVDDIAADEKSISPEIQALVQHAWGRLYRETGRPDKAISCFQNELSIYDHMPNAAVANRADCMRLIAEIYMAGSEYDLANEYFKKSLGLWLQSKGARPDKVAELYLALGNLHYYHGDYRQALAYYSGSETAAKACNDNQREKPDRIELLLNAGGIYALRQDHLLALKCFTSAKALAEHLFGQDAIQLAPIYSRMADVYLATGKGREALAMYFQCLQIWQDKSVDQVAIGQTLVDIGKVYCESSDYKNARVYLSKALKKLTNALGTRHADVARCHEQLGHLYAAEGNLELALNHFQQALKANTADFEDPRFMVNPALKSALNERQMLTTLIAKAGAQFQAALASDEKEFQLRQSLSTLNHAVKLFQNLLYSYKRQQHEAFLAEQNKQLFEMGIVIARALALTTGSHDWMTNAFSFAERSRMAAALEMVFESRARHFAGVPDSVLTALQNHLFRLSGYEEKLIHAKRQKLSSAQIDSLRSRLQKEKTDYVKLLEFIQVTNPAYYNLKFNGIFSNIGHIQNDLLDESTTILQFFWGHDSLYTFIVTAETICMAAQKPAGLSDEITSLRRSIKQDSFALYTNTAHSLFKRLIAPYQHLFRERLLIIPDGPLSYLPFEALLTKPSSNANNGVNYAGLPYLLSTCPISYGYAATLALGEQNSHERLSAADEYLAFAMHTTSASAKEAPSAPDTLANEVTRIGAMLEERQSLWHKIWFSRARLYLDEQATKTALEALDLEEFKVLHFATPVFLNEANPRLSGLAFSRADSSHSNHFLPLSEIYNLNLNAELVVLSNLTTGSVELSKGNELLALRRAFLYAGANNLLLSLWKTPGSGTADLMSNFYSGILNNFSYSRALQQAKLDLIAQGGEAAKPLNWSPFILVGR